jgi:hypothetical protein
VGGPPRPAYIRGGVGLVREAPGPYRSRHPEHTPFYRLIETHFARFATVHEERFEPTDGPLRAVVRRVVDSYLDCGRPENGFARVRCPRCAAETITRCWCAALGRRDRVPGVVASIQTFGSQANLHVHALVTVRRSVHPESADLSALGRRRA